MKLDLTGLSPEEKVRAKSLAGQILVDEINDYLDRSESPVSGGKFKKELTYKKGDSTLFEFGDMRSQITYETGEDVENYVEVGIFENAPEVERLKSFNHNTGDTLPQRRFIASPNQRFEEDIMTQVNNAVESVREQAQEELNQLVEEILNEL